MDQITKLLEQLAVKLGTTVEYLWGVLIKQAFLAGISNLIFLLFVLLFVLAYAKYIKICIANWKKWGGEQNAWGYRNEGLLFVHGVIMTIAGIASIILVSAVIIDLPTTFAAFFNPEYWALNQVLNTIK